MEHDMNYADLFPRMEKWLAAYGLPAEDVLQCTQFVSTGDPTYLIVETELDDEKDQATDNTRDLI